MRWIFISLLVFNAVAFAWGWFFDSSAESPVSQSVTPFAYKHVRTIELLDEVDTTADQQPSVNSSASSFPTIPSAQLSGADTVSSSSSEARPLCELVGPFKDKPDAEDFLQRLTAMDVRARVKEIELPAGLRYQIYLPPEESQKAALRKLAELQAKKIDSYVIPKGELENGISLGLYSRQELADQRLKEMKAIGLPANIKVIERTYWETWVMLEAGEGEKMSDLAWSRVMEGINHTEIRQNFCLPVASDEKFH